MRKRSNKKSKRNVIISQKEGIQIPNIRDVPMNCRHLVKEDDVLYVVPGDGCCGPNCAAAFLFSDEIFGPKLRRKMNLFMAKHWNLRYKFITQCSPGHPFRRRLRGDYVSFTDSKKLLRYLKNSENASFMWSDSEDLAIIADMYQLQIKVITTKGKDDQNPTINYITPELKMKQFAESKNADLGEMVLFHEDDSHFNLVVSRNSELATSGNLSHRFNLVPVVNNEEALGDECEEEQTVKMTEHEVYKDELKKYSEMKSNIETEYFRCEKVLRDKTEENEKLKIEVNDLKQILKLKDELHENGLDEPIVEKADIIIIEEKSTNVKNNLQKKVFSRKTTMLNCSICIFQCTTNVQLNNHKSLKHPVQKNKDEQFNNREEDV